MVAVMSFHITQDKGQQCSQCVYNVPCVLLSHWLTHFQSLQAGGNLIRLGAGLGKAVTRALRAAVSRRLFAQEIC